MVNCGIFGVYTTTTYNMAPYFSILIPLYNKELYVANTIKSVLAQSFTDFEIIIADDGSTDSSAAIVKSFDDCRIKYFIKENEGVSAARNFAMQMAQGDYFAFLDADDIWLADHLQLLAEGIKVMPNIEVFSTLTKAENEVGEYMPVYTNLGTGLFQEADFFRTSFARSILHSSTIAMHKSVPLHIGKFDTSLITFEDIDYWIRIGLKYKIGVINKVTAMHVYVPGSLSHKKFRMADTTYFEKFNAEEKENADVKKMIDINRYSLALRCKMAGDKTGFNKLISLMDYEGLSLKQKIILKLPGSILRILQYLKQYSNVKF